MNLSDLSDPTDLTILLILPFPESQRDSIIIAQGWTEGATLGLGSPIVNNPEGVEAQYAHKFLSVKTEFIGTIGLTGT